MAYTVRWIVLKMKKKFPLLRIRISSKYQIWGLPKVFSGMLWCISFMLFQAMLLVHYCKGHLVFCFGNITHIVRIKDHKSSISICVCMGTNKHQRCINMTTSPLNFGVLNALQSVGTSSLFVWVYYQTTSTHCVTTVMTPLSFFGYYFSLFPVFLWMVSSISRPCSTQPMFVWVNRCVAARPSSTPTKRLLHLHLHLLFLSPIIIIIIIIMFIIIINSHEKATPPSLPISTHGFSTVLFITSIFMIRSNPNISKTQPQNLKLYSTLSFLFYSENILNFDKVRMFWYFQIFSIGKARAFQETSPLELSLPLVFQPFSTRASHKNQHQLSGPKRTTTTTTILTTKFQPWKLEQQQQFIMIIANAHCWWTGACSQQ